MNGIMAEEIRVRGPETADLLHNLHCAALYHKGLLTKTIKK